MSSDILQLTYVIWGHPINTMDTLNIPTKCKGSDLKFLIATKLSLEHQLFALYKLCREVPKDTECLEDLTSVRTLKSICLWEQLSDVFSEPLEDDHLHLVIHVSGPAPLARDNIELLCWVFGDKVTNMFKVKLPWDNYISELKESIREVQPSLKEVDLSRIDLYDVSIPINDMEKAEETLRCLVPDKIELTSSAKVYNVFPSPHPRHLHVIVHIPAVPVPSYLDSKYMLTAQDYQYLKYHSSKYLPGPIFFGSLPNTQRGDLWVKFVQSYSAEAHQCCARQGHAPELLGHQRLYAHWSVVVMKNLGSDYCSLHEMPRFSAFLIDNIRQALNALHKEGFVHGDLRSINIMVYKYDSSKFMIIDWDWSGRIGVVRYPGDLNPEVERPAGAKDGELILPEHDLEMLDYIAMAYSNRMVGKRPLSSAGQEFPHKIPRIDVISH